MGFESSVLHKPGEGGIEQVAEAIHRRAVQKTADHVTPGMQYGKIVHDEIDGLPKDPWVDQSAPTTWVRTRFPVDHGPKLWTPGSGRGIVKQTPDGATVGFRKNRASTAEALKRGNETLPYTG